MRYDCTAHSHLHFEARTFIESIKKYDNAKRRFDRRLIIFLKDVWPRYAAIENSITKVVELLESDWKYKIPAKFQRKMSIDQFSKALSLSRKQHYSTQRPSSILALTLHILTSVQCISWDRFYHKSSHHQFWKASIPFLKSECFLEN